MANERAVEPRLLILETSTRVGRVALAHGEQFGPARVLDASRRHARDLAPAIVELCRERSWRVRDLDGVLVSRGPGSYTGLRVGLMTAKSIAYAAGAVLLALDTFQVIAMQTPPEATAVDVLADAQQRNLYVQRFRRTNDKWNSECELAIQPASQWLASLGCDVWVSGPAMSLIAGELTAGQPCVAPECREPMPQTMLALGLERWRNGDADDFWQVAPLYLRSSNAEVNWDKRQFGRPPSKLEVRKSEVRSQK